MLDVMTKAKNAIEAYNTQLRINSSNIANMSVPGYKTMKISFQTIFEKMMNEGTSAGADIGGTNPIQLGASVGISSTHLDFSQGTLTEGLQLDMAIIGSGLFIVSPDDGTTKLYTRAGKFLIDSAGNLTTDNGMQVYGLSGGTLVPITGLTAYNMDQLSWTNNGQLAEYNLKADGTIDYDSINQYTGYSIALTSFKNLSGLAQASGNTFAETSASGVPQTYKLSGDTYGTVTPRNYEQSNVFYTGEIIDAQEAERAMSGNLTILRMISDEITNFINRIS
ncbi:MAG: flagellar hook basal-body protein [bacterium]